MSDLSATDMLNMLGGSDGTSKPENAMDKKVTLSAKELQGLLEMKMPAKSENQYNGKPIEETNAKKTVDWFMGGKRNRSIPLANNAELGLPAGKARALAALLATTASDDRLQRGIQKIIPEATFQRDEYGNMVVGSPSYKDGEPTGQFKVFYPNPSGLQAVDLMQGAGALSLSTPIAKGFQALGMGINTLRGMATVGATEAGIVELASSRQTDSPYQVSDIPMGAVGAAVFGKLVSLLGRLQSQKIPAFDANGNLTREMQRALAQAGIDPNDITPDIARSAAQKAAGAVSPVPGLAQAQADALPVPVPLTKGQASGSRGQQLIEDDMLKSKSGDAAAATMEAQLLKQQEALMGNVDSIQQGMGGPQIGAQGEGGIAVSNALQAQKAADSQVADDLYTTARSGGTAYIDTGADSISASLESSGKRVLGDFSIDDAPNTWKRFGELQGVLSETGDVSEVLRIRKLLVNTGNAGTAEQKAARELRNAIDAHLEQAIDQKLFSGNPDDIANQLAAIRNYADYAKKWKRSNNVLTKLTEKTPDGTTLKQQPEAVTKYLFNLQGARLNDPNLLRDIKILKAELPEQEWNMLRQEAFKMLADKGMKGVDNVGSQRFNGRAFQRAWNDMKRTNDQTVRALFTKEEIKTINNFASVASRTESALKNTSNSGNLLSQLGSSIGGFLGDSTMVRALLKFPVVKGINETFVSPVRASQIMKPGFNRAVDPQMGAGGSALNTDLGQQMVDERLQQHFGVSVPRRQGAR